MTIIINVIDQQMDVKGHKVPLAPHSKNFIKLTFLLPSEWKNFKTFAQFRQSNNSPINVYLDESNSVYVPREIKAGNFTVMLYGAGESIIGTTNCLIFDMVDNCFSTDAIETDLTPTLYQQLLNEFKGYLASTKADAESATASENAAKDYATAADTSAQSAATSASNATAAEKLAKDSATKANASAELASNYANKSEESAKAALASQQAASESQKAAGKSATTASGHADTAKTYATQAETASTSAEEARKSASASAMAANASATEAKKSENAVKANADQVAADKAAVEELKTQAASSATAAASSANSAATSAKSAQDYASKAEISAMPSLEQILSAEFALRRTGKVFATKIYRFAFNTTSMGERLRDSVGLTCEPSTDTTVGQDDFITASPIFTYQRCNYIRDDDGTARVTALEGSPTYRTTGACDVGNVYPTFYWGRENHGTYDIYYMSDTEHPELGLIPWCEAVKADNTVLPIYVHSPFAAGVASDGLLRSQPGLVPAYNNSYNSMIAAFQKKGSGYWGAGSERNLWGMLMLIIKYATKNVQKIFAGQTLTRNMMEMIAHAETSTKRVLITNNDMGFFDGMCVSVGSAKNQDPNTTRSYDIVNRAKVTGIENVEIDGKSYTAINLDVDKTFDTAETYWVKCYPSIAGETDHVIGHLDGSYLSNTDGKHPFRILGTEFMWGQAMIESNSMSEKDANGDWLQYFAPKGVKHVANAHTGYICAGKIPGDSSDYWIGDIDVDTRGFMWPSTKGTSDSLGTGDRVWGLQNGSAGDLRERYTIGWLWDGSATGFASVNLGYDLSLTRGNCGCCD